MEKAKFWLIQIVMVAFVSLVFGSPVMAHSKGGYKWDKKWSEHKAQKAKAYKAEKRDNRYHKKMDRKITKQEKKIAKHYKKIARYEKKIAKHENRKHSQKWHKKLYRKISKQEKKIAKYEKKIARYNEELDRHNATYHASDPVEAPVVAEAPVVEEEPVVEECVPIAASLVVFGSTPCSDICLAQMPGAPAMGFPYCQ